MNYLVIESLDKINLIQFELFLSLEFLKWARKFSLVVKINQFIGEIEY